MRLLPVVAVGLLIATGAASAPTPLVRTIAEARGHGSVRLAARTGSIHTELWLDRIGGTGLAHVAAAVSCHEAKGGLWIGETFSFVQRPSSRHLVWRHRAHSRNCVLSVSVTVRGPGLLRVALRGY